MHCSTASGEGRWYQSEEQENEYKKKKMFSASD